MRGRAITPTSASTRPAPCYSNYPSFAIQETAVLVVHLALFQVAGKTVGPVHLINERAPDVTWGRLSDSSEINVRKEIKLEGGNRSGGLLQIIFL